MSSGGTRAARAATSRQVKQELVRLLFGKKYSRTGPEGHKKLDSAAYSYAELKSAYLEKLQGESGVYHHVIFDNDTFSNSTMCFCEKKFIQTSTNQNRITPLRTRRNCSSNFRMPGTTTKTWQRQ